MGVPMTSTAPEENVAWAFCPNTGPTKFSKIVIPFVVLNARSVAAMCPTLRVVVEVEEV